MYIWLCTCSHTVLAEVNNIHICHFLFTPYTNLGLKVQCNSVSNGSRPSERHSQGCHAKQKCFTSSSSIKGGTINYKIYLPNHYFQKVLYRLKDNPCLLVTINFDLFVVLAIIYIHNDNIAEN